MDEATIIQRVQEGDVEAYGRLMDLHVRRLRAVIALQAPTPSLIDEIAHEAFVFAFRHIQEFQRGTSFFAWIRSIAWNLLRAEIQRFSREQANKLKYAEKRLFDILPHQPAEAADQELERLGRCMEKITPRMQELLQMRYSLSFSAKEIADRTDHSVAWVRTTLFRLRRSLRDCVEGKMGTA